MIGHGIIDFNEQFRARLIQPFHSARLAAQRPLDDALQLGESAVLSRASGAAAALLRTWRRGARVVAECHWQTRRWERPTLVALHGLNGSSGAHYMRGLAAKAFARGMNVVRLNQRNCGDTEHLADGLFHSGLTADAAHVVHELTHVDGLPALAVAGYSLGGNLALKLAGEHGAHPPRSLVAVAAVSPIIEIDECTKALERPENVLYQWNFVKDLKAADAAQGIACHPALRTRR
jgi:predicted alpha/beta-fold hydrolase